MSKLTLLNEKTLWQGRYMTVKGTTFKGLDGKENVWEFVARPHGVVFIFPLTSDGNVILIKQFRIPLARYVIEMPAGLMDKPNESPEAAARRELLEETGYIADELIPIKPAPRGASAAIRGSIYMFVAPNSQKVSETRGDATEDIEVLQVPYNQLVPFLLSQPENIEIDSHVLAVYAITQYRDIATHAKKVGTMPVWMQYAHAFLERVREAAEWTGSELQKRGVIVRQAKEKLGEVRVYVDLKPNQHDIYRAVYREARERFPELSHDILCSAADYPDLLQDL